MKNKKFFAILLSVVLLLAMTFVLFACGDNQTEKPDETTSEVVTNESELKVSFDENATFAMDDEAIVDALSAEIVSGGVSRKVEVEIKSIGLTDDGQYIKVVVSAEGIDKELILPFEAEPEIYVREELKPLYNLLKNGGDKSFSFELSVGSAAAYGDTPQIFSLKAMVNKTARGFEFAVVDTSEAETSAEKALVIYKNGKLNVGGVDADLSSMLSVEADNEGKIVMADDSIDNVFEALSNILDTCDSALDTPGVAAMIGFRKVDGVYNITTDSKKLVAIAQLFLSGKENVGFDVDEVIDLIDEQLGGAIRSGDIKVILSLAIENKSVVLGVSLQNETVGGSFGLTAALTVADEAFEIPEAAAPDLKDIEIEIPLSTPNGKLDITGKIVIYSSEIITASGKNYITGTFTSNGKEDAAKFVLNDKYILVDVSGFTDGQSTLFYKAFEIDGQPVSIFEYIRSSNASEDYYEEDMDMPEVVDEDYDYDDDYYGGYSCVSNLEDGLFILNIGATEDDLRAQINLVVNDEPVTDYQIEGFDSSESAEVEVDLIYGDLEISITVIIRDAEKAEFVGFDFEPVRLALGSDVATAEQDGLYADIIMTDGQVQWTIYKNGFTVDKVNGEPVDSGYVFNAKGDIMLSLTHKNGETTEVSAYVYDPENLEIIDVDIYPDNMYLYEYLTEEELRDRIYVSVLYDDGSWKDIETFEIIGYEPGTAEFEVKFGEYVKQITIEYDDYISDDQPTGFNILGLLNYLRVTDILASEDPSAAFQDLLEQNKELLKSIFTFDKDSKTLRVVINSKNGGDLVEVINIFFGIPGEEGFTDIDENYLIESAGTIGGMFDTKTLFNMMFGVDFADFLTDLYLDAGVSSDDGIALTVKLNNGGDVDYFVTGFTAKFVDAPVSNFEITEEDIAIANEFDMLPMTLLAILLQIMFY